jgi:hypothetical protein
MQACTDAAPGARIEAVFESSFSLLEQPKMDGSRKKSGEQSLGAYLEADKEHHDGPGECCGVTWLTSDRHGCAPRETVSRRAAGELDKLARKTERKPQAWIEARRS